MEQHSPQKDCFLLFIVIGLVYFLLMGSYPFLTPDEGRYIEIPREMLQSGDYFIPHLNGVPYFEKPPLFYWMQTLSLAFLGPSTWAMRAWVSLLGVLGCLSTYLLGNKLWNRQIGLIAAGVQASAVLYFLISHAITLDSALSFFLTLSMQSLLYGVWRLDQGIEGYRRWFYSAYIFAGLAVMSKGLIGVVFPIMIVGLFVLITQRWSLLLRLHIIPGLLIIVLLNFPWHYAVWQQYPDFLKFYFLDQQFARYATPIAGRAMGYLSYIAIVIVGLFPWTVLLGQSLQRVWQERNEVHGQYPLFLGIWGVSIVLFFFFSHSILVPYLLPIVAPFSLLIARYLDSLWAEPMSTPVRAILTGLCVIVGLGFGLTPYFRDMGPDKMVWVHFATLAALFWLMGLYAWNAGAKNGESFFKTLLASCTAIYVAMVIAMPDVNTRSVKPLTDILNPLLVKYSTAKVVSFEEYHQDMPYYLNRTVIVAGWTNELTFGIHLEPKSLKWMIDLPAFWSLWRDSTRVYAIGPLSLYEKAQQQGDVCLLGKTVRHVLVMNRSCGS